MPARAGAAYLAAKAHNGAVAANSSTIQSLFLIAVPIAAAAAQFATVA
ncbi:MAG: hypothetical protein ACRDY2_13065 [Acidimicrobiales bacterium]